MHLPANATTPYRAMAENGMLSATPSAAFHQRQNSGQVMCSLNDSLLPDKWAGSRVELRVQYYDTDSALSSAYQYMFQKVSEKSLILLDRIRELGGAICHHNSLPSPLSVAQPSLEPAVFTGKVVCEGEGHLNPRSCLLEGPSHTRQNRGVCVRLEIPNSLSCSLFPGQVVAVEGINNYNGVLIPSTIYDEGVFPPLPRRGSRGVAGFTILCAAGPFTTTESLSLAPGPLDSLLDVVSQEHPDVLILLGPFLDSTHPQVKNCDIPGDLTFEEFFHKNILALIIQCTKSCRTKLVLVPSQRDVHHPWMVYPQPPFKLNHSSSAVFCAPDPATLEVGGLCLGLTSTDVLFHLSAKAMFRGYVDDRMARVTKHLLQQQCYYPLLPAYRREEPSTRPQPPQNPDSTYDSVAKMTSPLNVFAEEANEVNLDLVHMFDYKYACMPAKPDLLLLPSNLKPFTKVIDGCVCVNPGHLTKKTSGGTFAKIMVSEQSQTREDLSQAIAVQIVHI